MLASTTTETRRAPLNKGFEVHLLLHYSLLGIQFDAVFSEEGNV
jgi:hypothetical protein